MLVSLTGKYFDTSAAAKASGGPTFDYVAFPNAIFWLSSWYLLACFLSDR